MIDRSTHDIDDLLADADPKERSELVRIAERLHSEAPVPAPSFRGDLGRRLMTGSRPASLPRIRRLVTVYAGCGLTLLLIAAIGVAGSGPLAAG